MGIIALIISLVGLITGASLEAAAAKRRRKTGEEIAELQRQIAETLGPAEEFAARERTKQRVLQGIRQNMELEKKEDNKPIVYLSLITVAAIVFFIATSNSRKEDGQKG